jgi:predicted transcriptional regulator
MCYRSFGFFSGDGCEQLGGIDLRNLLTDYLRKCPADLRTILLPIELERHIPPRSLASLQSRPISTLANFSPIFASSTNRDELERLCSEHPYQQFPLITNGQLIGTINRSKILGSQSPKIEGDPAEAIPAHSTIKEAVAKMVGNSMSLLVVLSATENIPIGIVTLHDVLRLQTQLSDAALL